MPIYYYTWTASLNEESISFRILESNEDDARQQLLQKIQDTQAFRESYEKFERQIQVNHQNKALVEKKTLDAYALGDETKVESLERALQTIHDSNRMLQYEKRSFLRNLDIDTRGMMEEHSPFSVHLDAIVRDENNREMKLRKFLGTTPTVTPAHKIEIFHTHFSLSRRL